ncbi:MAG: 2-hydroxyacyl-CoA dehydratase family protein [Eggerthellales bacterium]|nr:2-hydroxyacyl-CoA dehydratase family protein [Eggerthellales bacterium]
MERIEAILSEMQEASEHPVRAIQRYNTDDKKVIGLAPYFVPKELVRAAGMYPVELWGGDVTPSEAHKYYPVFYCSILLTLMELGLKGDYDFLSGIIIPTTCDGLRNLEEDWKYAKPDMPVISFVQPVKRSGDPARRYYAAELHHVQHELEKISGTRILDRDLHKEIQLANEHRALMRRFDEVAPAHLDIFTPTRRHWVYKAARVMPREVHAALVSELLSLVEARPAYDFKGIKLVATSLLIDSEELLSALEAQNIAIVGDDVAGWSKPYETDAPRVLDPFLALADIWQGMQGCSVLYDEKKLRGELLIQKAKERGAQGVLISIIKFCEEEEFDYPVLKDEFAKAGLPALYLESETQGHVDEQAATRIQAFAEML